MQLLCIHLHTEQTLNLFQRIMSDIESTSVVFCNGINLKIITLTTQNTNSSYCEIAVDYISSFAITLGFEKFI